MMCEFSLNKAVETKKKTTKKPNACNMSEFQNRDAERSQTQKSNTICCPLYKVLKQAKPIYRGGNQISSCLWQGVGNRIDCEGTCKGTL